MYTEEQRLNQKVIKILKESHPDKLHVIYLQLLSYNIIIIIIMQQLCAKKRIQMQDTKNHVYNSCSVHTGRE